MGEKRKYPIVLAIVITILMVGSIFAGATTTNNSIDQEDKELLFGYKGDKSSDYFYMDFNPTSDLHTVDGGRFENGEVWLCDHDEWEVNGNNDPFDDTPSMPWASNKGVYSEVRNDEDLEDGTTTKGAWCSCAREQGGLFSSEDSRGWATVEKSFNLSDYVNTSKQNFTFTYAALYCDYKIHCYDFDHSNSHVYYNIYISDGTDEWPLEYQVFSGADDTPPETDGGYATDFWDPGVTGNNPNESHDEYSVDNYVLSTDGQGGQTTSPLHTLFNTYGDSYTIKFKLFVRCYGSFFFAKEDYEFWVDNVKIYCWYSQDSEIEFYTDPSDGGTITFDGTTYSYGESTQIPDDVYNISANPEENHYFYCWTPIGDISVANPYLQNTTADVTGDGILIAWFVFIPPPRTITFYTDPTNKGAIEFDGTIYYNGNETTTIDGTYNISAIPGSGYFFTNWTTEGGITVEDPTSSSTTATVTGDGSLTAWFSSPPRTISFYTTPVSAGSIRFDGYTYYNGDETIMVDDTYTISAHPETDFIFNYWIAAGGVHVENQNLQYTTADITGDGSLTAYFIYFPQNDPPLKPQRPSGTANGEVGVEYTYTSVTTDPDEDQIYYWFDWGDGTDSGWLGFYTSGDMVSTTHIWNEEGTYEIKVKAKDTEDAESVWSDPLAVTMPLNQQISESSNPQQLIINQQVVNAMAKQVTTYANVQTVSAPLQNTEWTVIVYLDGDNDLEYYAIDDFLEMASVGSTSDVKIVVQLDRIPGYDSRYGDWTTTKRYLVTQGMVPDYNNALMDIGEVNMGDPQTLINFVNWAKNSYPANNYCVILWDHGTGWKFPDAGVTKWICGDYSNGDVMEIYELRNALNTITNNGNNPLELIGFDACLMQMIEIGYEIADYAEYMTGSEETEPASGWDYDSSLLSLVYNPTMSAETLGAQFVNDYSGGTLSTVDLTLIESLADKVDDLADSLQVESFRDEIANAIYYAETYYDPDYVDLYHLAQLFKQYIDDSYVDANAQAVMDELDDVVTSEKHDGSHSNSHGLSIYAPYSSYNQQYAYLLFAQGTEWDEFLSWYHNGQSSNPPDKPTIIGPTSGTVGTMYNYTFTSIDPDEDDIYYYVDWGDYTGTEVFGPYASGTTIQASHAWSSEGAYVIKAKAVDVNGASSEWATLPITMPKSISIHSQSSSFVTRLANQINLLQRLLQR